MPPRSDRTKPGDKWQIEYRAVPVEMRADGAPLVQRLLDSSDDGS